MILRHAISLTKADNQTASQARQSLSILSFLSFGALGLSAPFINLYLKSTGLTGTQIGFMISVGALLELTLNPLINSIGDKTGRHRFVWQTQVALMAIAALIFSITLNPIFLGFAFLLNAVNARGTNEMLSQLTMYRLEEFGLRIFGKVRLWGSVGWAITTITSYPIIALGSYPLSFLSAAIVRLFIFPFAKALPRKTENERVSGFVAPVNKAIYVLMISQFIFFIGLNAFGSFIWIHFREGLGVAPQFIGFLGAWYAITELIPMRYVDRIIERLGARKVVVIGMIGMSIEWFLYGILNHYIGVLVLAFIKAIFFTMYTIASTILVSELSHPSRAATNRALVFVTMPALAMLISSPLVGWIYDNYAAFGLFSFASSMGLIACFFILSQYRKLSVNAKTEIVANSDIL